MRAGNPAYARENNCGIFLQVFPGKPLGRYYRRSDRRTESIFAAGAERAKRATEVEAFGFMRSPLSRTTRSRRDGFDSSLSPLLSLCPEESLVRTALLAAAGRHPVNARGVYPGLDRKSTRPPRTGSPGSGFSLDKARRGWQNACEAWVTPRVAHCDAPAGSPDRRV